METDLALMCDGSWRHWGVTPFEDPAVKGEVKDIEAEAGKDA